MKPQEILDKTREAISDYADNDRDKWFYANRFVFARLQLDERKTKTNVKKELLEANQLCHYCNKQLENKTGVHLHRLEASVDIVSITVLLCTLNAIQNSMLKIPEANAQVVLHLRKQLVVLLQS